MNVGIHVAKISHVLLAPQKKRKTMLSAIGVDCSSLGINTCQIFVQGPRNSRMSKMNYVAIKKYCDAHNITLFVHSSYISVGIFSVNVTNADTEKSQRAIKNIKNQLVACDALGAHGLVIHISKRTPDELCDSLRVLIPVAKKYKTPIILEQPAKKPDGEKTYETIAKINSFNDKMKKEFPKYKNWGWCIDTCHLWSAGIPVNNATFMKKWISSLNKPESIKLFHINGGLAKYFKTGKDTHIIPYAPEDAIWGKKKSSMDVIIKFAQKNNIPCILEINRGKFKEATNALSKIKKIT